MTVVQVGDVFDRGNASIPLQYYLWELRDHLATVKLDSLLAALVE